MTDFVFLHSGFRTGSSWLRSKFRGRSDTLVFSEIFHELLATIDRQTAISLAPGAWESRHPGVAPYFLEYAPIIRPEGGISQFSTEMAFDLYFPRENALSDPEVEYIRLLLDHAVSTGKLPVLSCTRSLARMMHIKKEFGGTHILLTRNPFDQWRSYSEQGANGNPYFLRTNQLIFRSGSATNKFDIEDVESGVQDFLSAKAFYKHALLYLTLYHDCADAADVIVSYDQLDQSDYRKQVQEEILSRTGLNLDLSDFVASRQFSLIEHPSPELLDQMLLPFLPSRPKLHPHVRALYERMGEAILSYTNESAELVVFSRKKLAELSNAVEELGQARPTLDSLKCELDADRRKLAESTAELSQLKLSLDTALVDLEGKRQLLAASEEAHTKARIEIARYEERAAQLQDRLATAAREREDELRRIAQDNAQKLGIFQIELASVNKCATQLRERLSEGERLRECLQGDFEQRIAESHDRIAAVEHERDQALAKAETLRAAAISADLLIRNAVQEPMGRWHKIGEALGILQAPDAFRALSRWSLSVGTESCRPICCDPSSASEHTEASQKLRASSLSQLLSWDDVDFVRGAYATILGRDPDPEGEAYYAGRLRCGLSKLQILWQLRKSEEGARQEPDIPDFDRELRRARWRWRWRFMLRRNKRFGVERLGSDIHKIQDTTGRA